PKRLRPCQHASAERAACEASASGGGAPRESKKKERVAMSARHMLRGCSVACVVWFAFAIVAAAEKPDFTGRWRIDSAKSTHTSTPLKNPEPNAPPPPPPPPPPDPNAPPIVITHNDPMLTIQESASHVVQLTTDGQENVNRLSGSRLNRSTSRWDGDKLVTTWTLEADGAK